MCSYPIYLQYTTAAWLDGMRRRGIIHDGPSDPKGGQPLRVFVIREANEFSNLTPTNFSLSKKKKKYNKEKEERK
jgi:hypothetical protein